MRFFFFFLLLSTPAFADESADDCRSALIENIEADEQKNPSVGVKGAEGSEPEFRHEGEAVIAGETVITDANTTADLLLCDSTVVRVGLNSTYEITAIELDDKIWRWAFRLVEGTVRAVVSPGEAKSRPVKFRIETPNGSIGVRGTELVVEHFGKENRTSLYTVEGEVLFGDKAQMSDLGRVADAGMAEKFVAVGPSTMSEFSAGDRRPSRPRRFDRGALQTKRLFRKAMVRRDRRHFSERMKKVRAMKIKRRSAIRGGQKPKQGGDKAPGRPNRRPRPGR